MTDLVNFVILTTILSVDNSGLCASTRILWAISRAGMAPRGLSKLNARSVPLYALLVTLCFALLSLLTSVVAAGTLFMVLMAVNEMSGTVTWIVIAYAQYRFHREHMASGDTVAKLKYVAPLFLLVPLACIAVCCSLLVFLAPDLTRWPSLYWGFGSIATCYLAYYVVRRRQPRGLGDPALGRAG